MPGGRKKDPVYVESLPSNPGKPWNRNEHMTEEGKAARGAKLAENTKRLTGAKGVAGGGIKREVRDRLAMAVRDNAHILIQLIAGKAIKINGKAVEPDIKEVMEAFKIVFKSSFEPLQPVVHEKMLNDLVDVLTDAKKDDGSDLLTLPEILKVKDQLIEKWGQVEA